MTADRIAPEELVPGAEFVLLTLRGMTSETVGTVRPVKVERTTTRDVVFDDGTRMRKDRLSISRGSGWGPSTDLKRPDDPLVAKVYAGNRRSRRRNKVRSAIDLWQSTPDLANTEALLAALNDWKQDVS